MNTEVPAMARKPEVSRTPVTLTIPGLRNIRNPDRLDHDIDPGNGNPQGALICMNFDEVNQLFLEND
jgi:hypothetical protein